jgi:hypothetical protein
MPTILKTKNSVTTTVVPTTLQQGELAVNITDKKLWVGNAATTPVQLLGAGVTGDVVGPASATDNAISRFDATTGKLIQNSLVTVSDTGAISAPVDASISGLTVGKGGTAVSTNTAVGVSALAANTTGFFSTAVGFEAGSTANAEGITVVGYRAGKAIGVNAYFSTFVGEQSGLVTTEAGNTGIGALTLLANTSGANNFAGGREVLKANTTGSSNTAVGGYNTMVSNTTGSNNTAVGRQALQANTTASNNTAVGYQAGYSNTAQGNIFLGDSAGYTNSSGTALVAIGYTAAYANTTGAANIAIGGYDAASAVAAALRKNTTGSYNIAIGTGTLRENTTGGNNTGIGYAALYSNTTASNNTAVGYQAAYNATTSSENTAIGYQALYTNSTSGDNVAVGRNALRLSTAAGNTVIGEGGGSTITTGAKNTILGRYTGNQDGLDIRTASNHIVLSDGDGNPRIVVDSSGNTLISTTGVLTTTSSSETGANILSTGKSVFIRSDGTVLTVGRQTSDGTLVQFCQAGTEEGTISVSGTTVSYNGGHLSRWSQLPDGFKDETIVKGTVMSNLDDMCVWEKDSVIADNEQLNKMKVSDLEGDINVAGVFVNWTMDEQYGVDDMNVAMTGDMIIRIAGGVVVQKGDLLMSAGDGTAKPQGDDIRRSKTVAKVTSNHVTCTYADGSYCVPCVLMAC